jgi:anti-sigma B factor antagonist
MADNEIPSRIADIRRSEELTLVTVRGDIDLQHSVRFQQEVLDLCCDVENRMILDLTQVDYLDSSGLASLVKVQSRCRKQGKQLRLVGLSTKVRGLFEITRLMSVFEIFDTVEEAGQ